MSDKTKMKTGCATTSGIDRGPKTAVALPHAKNLFGEAPDPHDSLRGLKREFTFPPFTVFNAREGSWQARKRMWLRLGIQSELGRGEDLLGVSQQVFTRYVEGGHGPDKPQMKKRSPNGSPGGSPRPACDYSKGERGDGRGRPIPALAYAEKKAKYDLKERASSFKNQSRQTALMKAGSKAAASPYGATGRVDDTSRKIISSGRNTNPAAAFGPEGSISEMTGVSVFDPVLCELMYRWFCPPGGKILDPFAGGSVRGITAAALGRKYLGIDLSARQIEANRRQAERICVNGMPMPEWVVGDSANVKRLVNENFTADMLFSCPPYANLEVYSNDPADISNMKYPAFLETYRKIIRRACGLLKEHAFAAWVVGEVRNTGALGSPYFGFVQDTIKAFQDAGLAYYNEAILVTAVGSLPLRTRKAFLAGRKMGRTHQTVLIFAKGDPRKAAFPL